MTIELTEEALLQRQNRELAIVNAIARGLNESVDLRSSLATALAHVAELLELHTGWVWLLDEETGTPYLAAAQNLPSGLARNARSMRGNCECLDAFRRSELTDAGNVVECTRMKHVPSGCDGLLFHATIPIRAQGRALGVMNVGTSEWRELTSDELRLLDIIGEMLGVAIERARLISRSLEMAATEERNRIAREIHDALAQGLSATVLQLETAEALLDSGADAERIRNVVHRALETTRENLDEARRSVLDLRAAPLEDRTLGQALRALCESVAHSSGLRVLCALEGGAERLPSRVEIALYRIAQESLTNVQRHAEATEVNVRLIRDARSITLTVEDDGRGFEARRCDKQGSFGLRGICERLRLLNGEMGVESEPGIGTRVVATVPLDDRLP